MENKKTPEQSPKPSSDASAKAIRERTLFGHPVGLFVLFFTEMWERFSYYGMRALLVLYLTENLIKRSQEGTYVFGFGALRSVLESVYGPLAIQPFASQIYGTYTSLVYLTPLFGGMLADRFFGQRKTVIVGGVLMAIGHFLMAFEALFLVALFFLILGNGCFKPNVSTQVGSLYPHGDHRRDGAFTIFYMGINLGALISPLICGTLGERYGWHYGFTAAGVGMVVGLLIYLWGQKYLAEDRHTKDVKQHIQAEPLTAKEWKGIFGLIALCILNIVYWGVYEQQGNTLQLFATKNTDWHFFGWEMPSTWFQAINPLCILIFAPLLSILWKRQGKSEPTSIAKMAIGSALMGVAFLVLIYLMSGLGEATKISFIWLAFMTAILTIGELYISPVGLSLVTKVAPARFVSLLMGMWFLSSFFGNQVAAYIGIFYEAMSKMNFFCLLAGLSFATGIAIYALKPPLQKAIGADI